MASNIKKMPLKIVSFTSMIRIGHKTFRIRNTAGKDGGGQAQQSEEDHWILTLHMYFMRIRILGLIFSLQKNCIPNIFQCLESKTVESEVSFIKIKTVP